MISWAEAICCGSICVWSFLAIFMLFDIQYNDIGCANALRTITLTCSLCGGLSHPIDPGLAILSCAVLRLFLTNVMH